MPILGAFCEEVLEKPGRNAEEAGDVGNRKSEIGSGNVVIEGARSRGKIGDEAASLDGAV